MRLIERMLEVDLRRLGGLISLLERAVPFEVVATGRQLGVGLRYHCFGERFTGPRLL